MIASLFVALLAPALSFAQNESAHDLRTDYDVLAYRIDVEIDPTHKAIQGKVAIELRALADLSVVELDLQLPMQVTSGCELAAPFDSTSALGGKSIACERDGKRVRCRLSGARAKGEVVRIVTAFSGEPRAKNDFDGFHWRMTADGKPWIATSCQSDGSSSWWPCKDSFFHPDDKPERTLVNLTVPLGLSGVSNGRLVGRDATKTSETTRWIHEYPCETYAIAINVGPYVEVTRELALPGLEKPLAYSYFVLPEHVERAKVQFTDVPRMLEIYSDAFGPYPFPKSKYALVEVPYWGMEHSTCVAYGSSFPAYARLHGEKDPYATMNVDYDYILIHESAHEWWGNAVSAKAWGHFWIHEGFATYAESVYLERLYDRARADAFFARLQERVDPDASVFRGEHVDSEDAYAMVIYDKGACVLNTLRHFVDDDAVWWKTLREFNLAFRYGNADTEDFRASLEKNSRRDWKPFFDEWIYGRGYPELSGEVRATGNGLTIAVDCGRSADTEFHVPLDVTWKEGAAEKRWRWMLAPGKNELELATPVAPTDVRVVHLDRVLGRHSVTVR